VGPRALERHARYFDRDGDGSVSPAQTVRGMTDLGMPRLLAVPLALLINGALGYLTRRRVSFTIAISEIERGKHPFESGVFGDGGRFDAVRFESLFTAPHMREPRDRLTYRELRAFVVARGDPQRPFGVLGSLLSRAFSAAEMFTLFCLAADSRKLIGDQILPAMTRRNLLRFYEGRLFPVLVRRRRILRSRAGG